MPSTLAEWSTLLGTLLIVCINAIISYLNNQHLAAIKTQTNHLTSALVAGTGASNFQAGVTAAIVDPQAAQEKATAGTQAVLAANLKAASAPPPAGEQPKGV